jgi:hypothetical protein
MNASELELFATQDLINELLRRSTFQGVIVHAIDGAKNRHWDGERLFAVRHNANLDTEEAGRLLDVVSQYITSRE